MKQQIKLKNLPNKIIQILKTIKIKINFIKRKIKLNRNKNFTYNNK